MSMPRTPRVIAVGLLWLALASSALQAVPSTLQPREIPRAESGDLVATAWKWLVSILAPNPEAPDREAAPGQKEDHGSQVDPDGNH